jgi:hypothetical protein
LGRADPAGGFRDRVIADAGDRGQVLLERPRQAAATFIKHQHDITVMSHQVITDGVRLSAS